MQYNIHPIIVHFPIAFLFIYSIIKILPLERWVPKVSWKQIERVLLTIGLVGAIAADSTGELAEQLSMTDHNLVEAHSFFAGLSIFFFSVLLAGEIAAYLNFKNIPRQELIRKFLNIIERIIAKRPVSIILAILGLISITLTGMLGGVLVYGTTADPLAPIILKLLGL